MKKKGAVVAGASKGQGASVAKGFKADHALVVVNTPPARKLPTIC
ncbi:hypothetical protein [Rhizobium sp. P38BS-XIX]|nr:hypothetical protein [Rhizobium sp. P38BS-XIX]